MRILPFSHGEELIQAALDDLQLQAAIRLKGFFACHHDINDRAFLDAVDHLSEAQLREIVQEDIAAVLPLVPRL